MYFLLKMVIFQPAMLVYHRLNFRVCFPIRRTWLAHFGRGCRDSNGLPVVAMSSCFTRKKQMLIHLFSYFPGAKKSCQFRKISQKKKSTLIRKNSPPYLYILNGNLYSTPTPQERKTSGHIFGSPTSNSSTFPHLAQPDGFFWWEIAVLCGKSLHQIWENNSPG